MDQQAIGGIVDENLIANIVACINRVRYGSVEIKIQDSKVIQIDVLEKRRLT